jgi:hypothetical protein
VKSEPMFEYQAVSLFEMDAAGATEPLCAS